MRLIFIDESGYTHDWKAGIESQPFYVASAICIPSDSVPDLYSTLRRGIDDLKLPMKAPPLGLGFEIKAREIARGSGWWADHNEERNQVRDLFLGAPQAFDAVAFVAIIDKRAHLARYVTPADPYLLALTFILERLEMLLSDVNDHGYCVYDHNTRIAAEVQEHTVELIREGSVLIYQSRVFDQLVMTRFQTPHILEVTLGESKNSIGLQVADYFATLTYHYYMQDKPEGCGWWDLLVRSLHSKGERVLGIGLKEFP